MRTNGVRSVLLKVQARAGRLPGPQSRSKAQRDSAAHGLLSLVIPSGLGDESAVDRTISALLKQKYSCLEVVVDSRLVRATDGLQQSEIDDPRLLLVPEHGGARSIFNAASGDFVAVVEPGAVPDSDLYGALVSALMGSSADFVAAVSPAPNSLFGRTMVRSRMEERIGLSLEGQPSAITDTELWLKLYRRTFFEEVLKRFPEPSSAEEIALAGFVTARSFDCLVAPVGRPASVPTLGDAAEHLSELLSRSGLAQGVLKGETQAEAVAFWFGETVGPHWSRFAEEVPRLGVGFWSDMREMASILQIQPGALRRFSVHGRVLCALSSQGLLEEFRTVLAELQDGGSGYRVCYSETGKFFAQPHYLPHVKEVVPDGLLELTSSDFRLHSRLRRFEWIDGTLHIGGFAYIEGLDTDDYPVELQIHLVNQASGKRLLIPSEKTEDETINEAAKDRWNNYSGAGFAASLEASILHAAVRGEGNGNQEWHLELQCARVGVNASGRLLVRDDEYLPPSLPASFIVNGKRIVAQMDGLRGLRLVTISHRYHVDLPVVEGNDLCLTFRDQIPAQAVLESANGQFLVPFHQDPADPAKFVASLDELGKVDATGEVILNVRAGKGAPLQYVGCNAQTGAIHGLRPSGDRFRLGITGFGVLSLVVGPETMLVAAWTLDGESLHLTIEGPPDVVRSAAALVLVGPHAAIHAAAVYPSTVSNRVQVEFPLRGDTWGTGAAFVSNGHYRLVIRDLAGGPAQPVGVSEQLRGVRRDVLQPRIRALTPAFGHRQQFVLRIASPYAADERGVYRQQQLTVAYRGSTEPLNKAAALFESFGGKSATDSCLAICSELGSRRPEVTRYWTVANGSVAVPEGCIPLLKNSREWFRVLATAKYLVNNNTFPVFFHKRPGQVYVQTWHGTPLKRIGFDTPRERLTPSYLRTLEREPGEWDLLVAQSKLAAATLAAAFRYTGEVAVVGYPRNDALKHQDAQLKRNNVRDRLGIPPGNTVLLYAPTWRDTALTRGGRHSVVNHLDFADLHDALGPTYTVLFRGHHNVADQRSALALEGSIDVTDYPHISDLCLAADALVTDYSSVMFDFAVIGKPMFFLVPDLDEYRDTIRGFYFDFEAEAPGPLAKNQLELTAQILHYDSDEWKSRYAYFLGTYASQDDGAATERLLHMVSI